jgi:hypothetical protein
MRRLTLPLALLLLAGCSAGARRPMSCNEAAFEPVVEGTRLGVRLTDPRPFMHFRYVRVDVLPPGEHAGPALLDVGVSHVRRFLVRFVRVDDEEFAFDFDWRDDAGRPLPHGTYEVGYVVRTENFHEGCLDAPFVTWGVLTTLTR